jgi:hypothetical protein
MIETLLFTPLLHKSYSDIGPERSEDNARRPGQVGLAGTPDAGAEKTMLTAAKGMAKTAVNGEILLRCAAGVCSCSGESRKSLQAG